jgi:hypothetical protein
VPKDAAVPTYRFDPNLGNPRDPYTPVDFTKTRAHRPEIPAVFVARVEGETIINTLVGRKVVAWHAEPGTPCVILGTWPDGTLHLRWPAIGGHYHVDGRFPAWVVAEDTGVDALRRRRTLRANDPPRRRSLLARLLGR